MLPLWTQGPFGSKMSTYPSGFSTFRSEVASYFVPWYGLKYPATVTRRMRIQFSDATLLRRSKMNNKNRSVGKIVRIDDFFFVFFPKILGYLVFWWPPLMSWALEKGYRIINNVAFSFFGSSVFCSCSPGHTAALPRVAKRAPAVRNVSTEENGNSARADEGEERARSLVAIKNGFQGKNRGGKVGERPTYFVGPDSTYD